MKQIVAMLEFCPQSLTAEAQSFQTLEVALWQQTWQRQLSTRKINGSPDPPFTCSLIFCCDAIPQASAELEMELARCEPKLTLRRFASQIKDMESII